MFAIFRRLFRTPSDRAVFSVARPLRLRFTPGLTALDERAVPDASQVFNGQFTLTGPAGTAQLTEVVTLDDPQYPGLYLWQLHLVNVDFGPVNPEPLFDGFDTHTGFDLSGIYRSGIDHASASNGDGALPWAFTTSGGDATTADGAMGWESGGFGGPNFTIPAGSMADFSFTTPPVTLVSATASLAETTPIDSAATGTVKGPGIPKATTTSLGVDVLWPDESERPNGMNLTSTVAGDARLGDPTGTVTFTDGDTTLGTATLVGNGNGTATATLTWTTAAPGMAIGDHPIIAEYSGDANHTKSQSDPTDIDLSEEDGSMDGEIEVGYGDGDGGGEIEYYAGATPPAAPKTVTASNLAWSDFREVPKAPFAAFTAGLRTYTTPSLPKTVILDVVQAGTSFMAIAHTSGTVKFASQFVPSQSYVVTGFKTAELLEHERLHLAIGEYIAAKANANKPRFVGGGFGVGQTREQAIQKAKVDSLNSWKATVYSFVVGVWSPFDDQIQSWYDDTPPYGTGHGSDVWEQAYWQSCYNQIIDTNLPQGWT